MTMFKLPDISHKRADAVVALSTQSTNDLDNVHRFSEDRRMSATESLLMLSPKARPVNSNTYAPASHTATTPKSMSTSLPQSNTMRKTRSSSLAGSLPPSPPLTPATPIAFPSPRVAPVRRNSRDNSPASLNDDPLDLYAENIETPFKLDGLEEEEEEEEEVVADAKQQHDTSFVFNMDSFAGPHKKTSSQPNSRSPSRGRQSHQPLAPDELDERGRSRHRNTSRGRS